MTVNATPVSARRPRVFGLDLIRSIAIALVFYEHTKQAFDGAGRTGLPDLPDGVEPFYILSGFLIGGLLLEIADKGVTFRGWITFMIRRWMRTLPLYYIILIGLFVAWPPKQDVADHVLYYGTMLQNLAWRMPHGNWFGVTWSLAVEEWFYLLFSITFLGLHSRLGRRGQTIAFAVFLILPLLARFFMPLDVDWDFDIRKIVLLRLDAIAYGAILARLWADRSRLFAFPITCLVAGLGLLGASLYASSWSDGWLFEHSGLWRAGQFNVTELGWVLLFPGLMLIKCTIAPLKRLVESVSEQSYCFYLIHGTLIQYFAMVSRRGEISIEVAILIALCLSWAGSWLSLHWFERHVLAMRPRQFGRVQADRPVYVT